MTTIYPERDKVQDGIDRELGLLVFGAVCAPRNVQKASSFLSLLFVIGTTLNRLCLFGNTYEKGGST